MPATHNYHMPKSKSKSALKAPLLAHDSLSNVPMADMAQQKAAGAAPAPASAPSAPGYAAAARRTMDDLVTTGASEMPTVAGLAGRRPRRRSGAKGGD